MVMIVRFKWNRTSYRIDDFAAVVAFLIVAMVGVVAASSSSVVVDLGIDLRHPNHPHPHPPKLLPLVHPYHLRPRLYHHHHHHAQYLNRDNNTTAQIAAAQATTRADMDVECMLRWVAYDMAMMLVPVAAQYHSKDMKTSLQLNECEKFGRGNDRRDGMRNRADEEDRHDDDDHYTKSKDLLRRRRPPQIQATQTTKRRKRHLQQQREEPAPKNNDKHDSKIRHLYLDCSQSYRNDDKNNNNDNDNNNYFDGSTRNRPLRTPHRVMEKIREFRRMERHKQSRHSSMAATSTTTIRVHIIVRRGHGASNICYLNQTLYLDESNMEWVVDDGDENDDDASGSGVVFSGGFLLDDLKWRATIPGSRILEAELPDQINVTTIDGLFAIPTSNSINNDRNNHGTTIQHQIRLTRARYPNGNSEDDRMPTNYDKLSGPPPVDTFIDAWRMAGNVSVRFPNLNKNSSFYPWFGHSRDIRWVQDYHLENASSYYGTQTQFWQPRIATAARFDNQPPSFCWPAGAVLHVIHYNWWGNWQWELGKNLNNNNNTTDDCLLNFARGGWQDAHGGYVSHNYFFIENVLAELDAPGEWFVDTTSRKLYYWPLDDQIRDANHTNDDDQLLSGWNFVATQLPVLVVIGSNNIYNSDEDDLVRNVKLNGITFAHTTTTYLLERYTVPSAGDWSVLPKGAVTLLDGAIDIVLNACTWWQVNGNGVALHGYVHNSSITHGNFIKVGDSGIVTVGKLPVDRPYSGIGDVRTVPTNITITKCHFGQTGVYGKQTSALFVALSKEIHFIENVMYDGPRAGVNINDGFGGGHVIKRNVIWNQVLESGDHGPINTWSRSLYLQEDATGAATTTPSWNYIDQNFIMIGPKFGSLYGPGDGPCSNGDPNFYCPKNGGSLFSCLDHDDGSEYYLDTRNVCAFAGMKNYIGQNKVWDSNLILFPEGSASQNRSGMSCLWTSMDMASDDKSKLPCSTKPCRTREVFTNNTCFTYYSTPLEYDMFNETDLALMGIHNTTIPWTERNRYFLPSPYQFHGIWNLTQAQDHGMDVGSAEYLLTSVNMTIMDCMVRTVLDMSC